MRVGLVAACALCGIVSVLPVAAGCSALLSDDLSGGIEAEGGTVDADSAAPVTDTGTDAEVEVEAGPPPRELVAWYRFDETSGTTAKNSGSGGSALDGIIGSGVTLAATGKLGGAMTFTGNNTSVVTVPDSPVLDINGPFAVEVWVAPTVSDNAAGVVSKMFGGIPLGGYYLHQNASGGYFFGRACLNPCATPAAPGGTIQLGAFQHLALTYDGTNVRFYSNAAVVATVPATGAIGVNSIPLTIGFDSYGGFVGRIDEVKIWNVVRTVSEVCADAGGTYASGACMLP